MKIQFHPFQVCTKWLRTKIPCDYRTFLFAFFVGSVLSAPLGVALALTRRPFEPPEWTEPYYLGAVGFSFLILPFWSALTLRSQPPLRCVGFLAFALVLFLFLLALMCPAL